MNRYHKESFSTQINNEIPKYNDIIINKTKSTEVNSDIFDVIDKFDYDTIYLDPKYPNTVNKYSKYYCPIDFRRGFKLYRF
ncbi:hypothetical protein [Halanaerobium praevalens]|uniref:hypothetical protein n=1 Tax=Halanaerobium praevalens TaxID=2331 RepID=UPI0002D58A4A|nr:hypothetical protein [Halanaerobium praevalens]